MSPLKKALVELVKENALQFGEFTLSSGDKSNFYLDARKVTISTSLPMIVEAFKAETLDLPYKLVGGSLPYDAVGGPTAGADPIVAGFMALHNKFHQPVRGFFVRKEEKGHGLAGLIIGSVLPGDKCLFVEDVTTTGASALKGIKAIEAFGCEIVKVVAFIDRSRGVAAKMLQDAGYPFSSVLTLEDLGIES